MWHYEYEDEIVFKDSKDPRNGTYLAYHIDTMDYILNNNDWVANNNAFDEQRYILDYLDMSLESNDGEYIYIPDSDTAMKIECGRAISEIEHEEELTHLW